MRHQLLDMVGLVVADANGLELALTGTQGNIQRSKGADGQADTALGTLLAHSKQALASSSSTVS